MPGFDKQRFEAYTQSHQSLLASIIDPPGAYGLPSLEPLIPRLTIHHHFSTIRECEHTQSTLSSRMLRLISILQNMPITTAGLANLPEPEEIKLYRCPSPMTVRAAAIVSLKVTDINAYKNINVQTIDAILELLRWSDIFQRGAFERNPDMMTTYVDFFKRVARHARSIELRRFSVDIFDRQSSGLSQWKQYLI